MMGVDTKANKEFGKERLSEFLRQRVGESMDRGYSRWGLNQVQALSLRRDKEPDVEVVGRMGDVWVDMSLVSFFPGERKDGNKGRRGYHGMR